MMKSILEGVTVLDFTVAFVGTFCTRILADMGADVIRIEKPVSGQQGERFSDLNSISFMHLNGGKKSLSVDLKTQAGVDLVKQLVSRADVVAENFTPHVMSSYGLDYESLRLINPEIIMISMTGYGRDGIAGNPEHVCTDPIAQAMSGLNWITGERGGSPYTIGGGIGDTITGTLGALSLGYALVHKLRTGEGQFIDLSMVESVMFEESTVMPYVAAASGENKFFRNGKQNTYTFPMGVFKAKEGYIALQAPGVGRESAWGRLCDVMAQSELAEDERYKDDRARIDRTDEVIEIVENWLGSLNDDEEALTILSAAHISSGPVLSQEEILQHPLFRSRGAFQTIDYPELGPLEMVAPPYNFSETPARIGGPAPQLGEHNLDVLSSHLGLSEEAVRTLTKEGVLYESEGARSRQAGDREAMT